MLSRTMAVLLCLALILSAVAALIPSLPAQAAYTTSVRIVKYAADGSTVLAETTVNYTWMEANLPVQGDGVTHYWMQGPSFDPDNLWDPDETVNLKDKGALKGTDIKDLLGLVGDASPGDAINIMAEDGYNEDFQYDDIYNPEPEQGKMVLCWWKDGNYAGSSYADAMQLVPFANTTNASGAYVFGNYDMNQTLPEANWHYYYSGGIFYPSCNGLSIKYIDEISIYTNPTPGWNLSLKGATNYTMPPVSYTHLTLPTN